MAWENLRAEIEEEFSGLQAFDYVDIAPGKQKFHVIDVELDRQRARERAHERRNNPILRPAYIEALRRYQRDYKLRLVADPVRYAKYLEQEAARQRRLRENPAYRQRVDQMRRIREGWRELPRCQCGGFARSRKSSLCHECRPKRKPGRAVSRNFGLCSHEGCPSKAASVGMCSKHYAAAYRKKPENLAKKCTITGCGLVLRAMGLCSTHWSRLRRHGHTETLTHKAKVCSIPDCGKKHDSKGLCKMHRQQQRRGKLNGS